MLRIMICDDDEDQVQNLWKLVEDFFRRKRISIRIRSISSGEALAEEQEPIDLLFLDIKMGEMDGITAAKLLRQQQKQTTVFFVTEFSQKVGQSLVVHPFAFLEKPVQKKILFQNLEDYCQYKEKRADQPEHWITLKGEQHPIYLLAEEICFCEYMGNRHVKITTTQKTLHAFGSMKELQNLLPQETFLSPHKSFLVNIAEIAELFQFRIQMKNGAEIPVAQKRQKQVVEQVSTYLRAQMELRNATEGERNK